MCERFKFQLLLALSVNFLAIILQPDIWSRSKEMQPSKQHGISVQLET